MHKDAVGCYYVCTVCDQFALCYKCYRSKHLIHVDHEFERRGVEFVEPEDTEGTEAGDESGDEGSGSTERGTNPDSDSAESEV